MNTLEVLLSRRWILKSREKELYYRVKDDIGEVKRFLMEKMGYQVIVNPYLVKVEKVPAKAERWMGIQEFTEPIEYAFFCLILMFLENKEAEEQFVLSELTEYVQGQYREEQIDWTVYRYRRHLIKVMKYCVSEGILNVDDGSEEGFAKDYSGEVLYENVGVSRFFMRNFTQDIMEYSGYPDFLKAEWIAVDEDRGIVRRQRVYRRLIMSMGICRMEENEEDFAYVRNYRNMIQGDLENLFPCELQVFRSSAYLIMGEDSRMGRFLPEENTLSDIVLLCGQLIREKADSGEYEILSDDSIRISKETFRGLLEECHERFGSGFIKTYREMVTEEFFQEISACLKNLELVEEEREDVLIRPVLGRVVGKYPSDFSP
ncbi:MAG: TIGR02678 family protein [Lachnospiraceae bacterium]|jgi:TIGR02678 family protein|nr:TIGR02678 family protein [Lachnospiraceae bacterium]MCI9675387.1 TIGR02678 family protein [Lachnospiraceae bacterium]